MADTPINPNVPVTEVQTSTDGKGSVQLNSGESPMSFDELEQITQKAKRSKTEAKKESKSEENNESKEEKPERKSASSNDLSSDDKKSKKEDPKPEKKEAEEDGKEQQASEAAKLRKKLKAKLENSEFELDEEAMIPVTINGKEEWVPVKDLRGNYSGKVAWDKRFTELDKRTKANSAQELKLRQAADMVKSTFGEQDPDLRMFKLAQLAGVDPVQYRQQYLNDNINMLEKWYNMSEAERVADLRAYEAKIYKQKADTLEGSIKQEQAQQALRAKLDTLRASHQVSEDEFVSHYDQINDLVRSGAIDKSQVTPEYVIETIEKERLWLAADKALQNLDLPWNTEQRGQNILNLVEHAHKLGFKPQDIAEIVDSTWGVKKAKETVQKVKEEREEFLSGKKPASQATPKRQEALFFDEIL